MLKYLQLISLAALLSGSIVHADSSHSTNEGIAPVGEPYKLVSDLVALPSFLPGMGKLYVDPDTLPAGPFLAYDRNNKLVSTVYMIPLDDMNNKQKFTDLVVADSSVRSVDITYNPGHPGVNEPHYHITLYHLDPREAALK